MSTFCKPFIIKFCLISIVISVTIFSVLQPDSYAIKPFFDEEKRTVVLDPGHGGHDAGVQGPDGTLEKKVVLTLSRLVADQLKRKYKVALTRSDDYWVDIPDRTAVANHLKADLFISIHTSGSFLHQAKGISIFYFKELPSSAPGNETAPLKPVGSSNSKTLWDNIQGRHITSSKALAEILRNHINNHLKFSKSKTQNAHLLVLKSADMPAILIEIGYLTNPGDEKALRSPQVLSDFAKAICNGIDDYFQTHQN